MAGVDLSTKIRSLSPVLKDSRIERAHAQLLSELAQKGLKFKPYIWISDDWFCPDGAPGFAVPFYLFDDSLMVLERKMMGRCEGASERELMKLMRHECGHAIDNAFGLRRKKERQARFGSSKTPYPKSYIPDLDSPDYVTHLGDGYAQAHPDEDWAETFAVWLGTSSLTKLKRRYQGTKAWEKLQYVDRLMDSLKGQSPKLTVKWKCDPVHELSITLQEYYREKRKLHVNHRALFEFDELRSLKVVSDQTQFTRLLHKGLHFDLAHKARASVAVAEKIVRELDRSLEQGRLGISSEASYTNKVLLDFLTKKTSQYLKEERNRIIM